MRFSAAFRLKPGTGEINMERYAGEAGYASVSLLGLLAFLSALAAGTSLWIGAARRVTEGEAARRADTARMDALAAEAITRLEADPSPELNSADDPVWELDGKTVEGFRVSIYPLSDRLNLNFVRKNVLEKTRLAVLFAPGKNPGDLQQFREDEGLSLFAEDYQPFFGAADIAPFFSCYGWANINLTDEFAARKLARSLTGSDAAAEEVRAKIQKLLMEQEICRPENLKSFLGFNYAHLFPWINVEPLININFASPALLRELAAYDAYEIDHVSARLAEIAARRDGGGIAREDIPVLLGLDRAEEHPLTQYLGAVTWFWEITVSDAVRTRRTVVCRLPNENRTAGAVYKIIEQRYY
jgi:hypothetical protein